MPRKIFICFFVVLLMTTLVVPAFASSTGGDHQGVAVPSVIIDYMQFLGGDSYPIADWPNNSACGNGSEPSYGSYTDICGFQNFYNGDEFETVIYPDASFSSVRLHIEDLFLTPDTVFHLDCNDIGTFYVTSVEFEGLLVACLRGKEIGRDDYFYTTASSLFSHTYSVDNHTDFVDFDTLLRIISGKVDLTANFVSPNEIIYLSDVNITINYYFDRSDPLLDYGMHFYVNEASSTNYFQSWFNALNLADSVSSGSSGSSGSTVSVNWFDWLLDSVNAFLNFEIVPDLSLNRIFYVVLVIGVLLWFITLLI